MAIVTPIPISLGGVVFSTYLSGVTVAFRPGMVGTGFAERSPFLARRTDDWPGGSAYGGSEYPERMIEIDFIIPNDASHEADIIKVKRLFRKEAGVQTLVFTDRDGVNKRMSVVCLGTVLHEAVGGTRRDYGAVVGRLMALDGYYLYDASSSVAAASRTSGTPFNVTNAGNVKSPSVVYTIQPTAAKTAANGQRYAYHLTICNRSPRPMQGYPVCLTHTHSQTHPTVGWDHAAEVTAGRSLASGNDVEVYHRGRRLPRWTSPGASWNTTTTRIWANLDMDPEQHWTVRTTAASGDATIYVKESLASGMRPVPFYVVAGTESILVTAYDATLRTFTALRGQRGSTAASQAADVKMYYAEAVDIVYGYTSIGAPDTSYDDWRPIFIQAATSPHSDNTVHMYDHYYELVNQGDSLVPKPRSASWMAQDLERPEDDKPGQVLLSAVFQQANSVITTAAANPVALLGLTYVRGDSSNESWTLKRIRKMGRSAADRFTLLSPVAISQVDYAYTVNVSEQATGTAYMQGALDVVMTDANGIGEIRKTEDKYVSASGTRSVTAPANIAAYVLSFVYRAYERKSNKEQGAQLADGTAIYSITAVKVTLDTSYTPLVVWAGSRSDIYQLGRPEAAATLANNDGDTLGFYGAVVALNETVTVDVSARTVVGANSIAIPVTISGGWPALPGDPQDGTTTYDNITYTEAGIGTVSIGASSFRSASN
jgi:hypothetical protein